MEEHEAGHEPPETDDERFAPVLRDADARGRTTGGPRDDATGTGVPGRRTGHPAALPPDTKGVREAERRDASRHSSRRAVRRGSSPRAT